MTLSEIYFNYNRAIEQANRLDEIARSLTNAANNTLQGIMNDVHQAWKSDSTSAYTRKGDKIGGDMRTTAGNLSSIAQAIRTIARRVRDAELEAWRIANERKSG